MAMEVRCAQKGPRVAARKRKRQLKRATTVLADISLVLSFAPAVLDRGLILRC